MRCPLTPKFKCSANRQDLQTGKDLCGFTLLNPKVLALTCFTREESSSRPCLAYQVNATKHVVEQVFIADARAPANFPEEQH